MRVSVVVADSLMAQAMRLTGLQTKADVVREALKSLVAAKRNEATTAIVGTVQFASGWDYKAERRGWDRDARVQRSGQRRRCKIR